MRNRSALHGRSNPTAKTLTRPCVLTALLAGAVGCSPTITHWRHQSGSISSFDKDNYQCESETRSQYVVVNRYGGVSGMESNFELWRLCMKSRGYIQVTESGQSMESDWKVAHFRRKCIENEWQACSVLGSFYQHGKGVQPDLAMAAALYQKACEHDDALGCLAAGDLEQKSSPRQALAKLQRARTLARTQGQTALEGGALAGISAIYYEQLFMTSEASAAIEEARRLLPEDLSVLSNRVEILLAQGRYSDVLREVPGLLAMGPEPSTRLILTAFAWAAAMLANERTNVADWSQRLKQAYGTVPKGSKSTWQFGGTRHVLEQILQKKPATQRILQLLEVLVTPIESSAKARLEAILSG